MHRSIQFNSIQLCTLQVIQPQHQNCFLVFPLTGFFTRLQLPQRLFVRRLCVRPFGCLVCPFVCVFVLLRGLLSRPCVCVLRREERWIFHVIPFVVAVRFGSVRFVAWLTLGCVLSCCTDRSISVVRFHSCIVPSRWFSVWMLKWVERISIWMLVALTCFWL